MPSLNELGRRLKTKHPETFGGMSDLEAGRKAKAQYPQAYAKFAGAEPNPIVKGALDLLPAAGGVAGALAGGTAGTVFGLGVGGLPGAAGGAALGGAGGEAARQLIGRALGMGVPQSSREAASNIVTQSAEQAAAELTGAGLARGVQKIGKPIMQAAIRATPEVAKTAIQEGITATSKGLQRLLNRIGTSGAQARHLARQAGLMGTRYDGLQLARQVFADVMPETVQPIPGPARRKLVRMTRQFLGSNPLSLNPERLHVFKQKADQLAKSIYDRIGRKEAVSARERIEAKWYKAFADRARQTLEATIPDYEAQNARTESLIRVKQAIWPSTKKEMGLGAQLASAAVRPAFGATVGATIGAQAPGNRIQNAAIGGVSGALAGTPQALSMLALLAHSPALAATLRQVPRAGLALAETGR